MAFKKRFSRIQDPDDLYAVQTSLLPPPGIKPYSRAVYPPIHRTDEDVLRLIRGATDRLGVDWEGDFDLLRPEHSKPTIMGVASQTECAAVKWTDELAREIVEASKRGVKLVAHSGLSADRVGLDGKLGVVTPIEAWEDTMLRYYAANQDLAKAPDKDEDDDTGSIGLMNLWAMSSYYLDAPNWKWCRGAACDGPCPEHRVYEYCAVDAWAGIACAYEIDKDYKRKNIPASLDIHLHKLTQLCIEMERQGVKVDLDAARLLNKDNEARKAALFPYEWIGKRRKHYTGVFNPQSAPEVTAWFKAHKINLKSTDKKEVLRVLKLQASKRGMSLDALDVEGVELDEAIDALHKLYLYKASGKSNEAWVGDKYVNATTGCIHPRFISTGASTGRLASSRPNFQNLPRMTGGAIRRCIIPRDPDLTIVKADYSQLELRVCLWYAGAEFPKNIPDNDLFRWIIPQKEEYFAEAVTLINPAAKDLPYDKRFKLMRDVSKRVAHAFNYMEGLLVLRPWELETSRRKSEIEAGALLVFDGKNGQPAWEYRNGIVCFSGVNLAEGFFGDKTFESRKKALQIQEVYSNAVPNIRQWHRTVSDQIERLQGIQSATGRFLELYGSPEDDLKMATAFLGQGGGADLVQEKMIVQWERTGRVPLMNIHDELVEEIPRSWTDQECVEHMGYMTGESKRLPGLSCPVKVSRGDSWGAAKEITL
jgi:hypothetical protein